MTETHLGERLLSRFGRLLWIALGAYAVVVVSVFGAVSEISLRRALNHSADVVQSLLGLYADPGGEETIVAPAMLADQLLEMREPFFITRAVPNELGERVLYYLSPGMPAKEVQPSPGASPDQLREHLISVIAERGRWRYRVLHRQAGDFDIFVAGTRTPHMLAVAGLIAVAGILLPIVAMTARRATSRTVENALTPLSRIVKETQSIDPTDLARRVTSPTGIAETTELSEEINRLVARVERAHTELEAFTADASHELRTPLTHLRAQAQWALDEHRTLEDTREALADISHTVEQMTKMVEDLLLIARGENQQLSLEPTRFDIGEVVRDVEEITNAMAANRGVMIEAHVDAPAWVFGDADRARQILLNFASNAVRHTADGSIRFSIEYENGMTGVAVEDTGCGIPNKDLDRIFDRFYRAEPSRSRTHGGAGLGLTIARLLAALQDGNITVESTIGSGTRFVLWLPASDHAGTDGPLTALG